MTFLYYFANGFFMAFLPQFMQLTTGDQLSQLSDINEVQWTILIVMSVLGGFREYRNRMAKPPSELTQDQQATLEKLESNMIKRNQE